MTKIRAQKSSDNALRLDRDGCDAISHIPVGQIIEIDVPSNSTGTVSMLRTWRMWMAQIAKHMAERGALMPIWPNDPTQGMRPFNADDAHESFTYLLLGCDDNGNRYSWSMGKGKNTAPKSKRLYAMDKLVEHAFDHAIPLKIPDNSEYTKIKESGYVE